MISKFSVNGNRSSIMPEVYELMNQTMEQYAIGLNVDNIHI